MVGEVRDEVAVGDPVEVGFDEVDDQLTLAYWRAPRDDVQPAEPGPPAAVRSDVVRLPDWELPVTPTLVVATALATRDYQDVHHDRDLAVARGAKDIFLNILTTTGLVQRYVTDWAGPAAVVRSCALRLGAPAHPGDTLGFTGTVAGDADGVTTVDVVGTVAAGAHVTARVGVVLP
jgi:hypothetical protein